MAFMLRRPFAVTEALKQAPSASRPILRNFSTESPKQSIFRGLKQQQTPGLASKFASSRNAFQQAFRRNYQQTANPIAGGGDMKQRLLYGAGIFGGTLFAINMIFNRETREDGGMPPFERKYVDKSEGSTLVID